MTDPSDFAKNLLAALTGDPVEMDPFSELVLALQRDGTMPSEWQEELHTIPSLWSACSNAGLLLRMAAYGAPGHELVRAACECARTVLHLVPPDDRRPSLVVRMAEEGAELDQLGRQTYALEHEPPEGDAAASAIAASRYAGRTAIAIGRRDNADERAFLASSAADEASEAMAHAAEAAGFNDDETQEVHDAHQAMLVDAIRPLLVCPTLEQVVANCKRVT